MAALSHYKSKKLTAFLLQGKLIKLIQIQIQLEMRKYEYSENYQRE